MAFEGVREAWNFRADSAASVPVWTGMSSRSFNRTTPNPHRPPVAVSSPDRHPRRNARPGPTRCRSTSASKPFSDRRFIGNHLVEPVRRLDGFPHSGLLSFSLRHRPFVQRLSPGGASLGHPAPLFCAWGRGMPPGLLVARLRSECLALDSSQRPRYSPMPDFRRRLGGSTGSGIRHGCASSRCCPTLGAPVHPPLDCLEWMGVDAGVEGRTGTGCSFTRMAHRSRQWRRTAPFGNGPRWYLLRTFHLPHSFPPQGPVAGGQNRPLPSISLVDSFWNGRFDDTRHVLFRCSLRPVDSSPKCPGHVDLWRSISSGDPLGGPPHRRHPVGFRRNRLSMHDLDLVGPADMIAPCDLFSCSCVWHGRLRPPPPMILSPRL